MHFMLDKRGTKGETQFPWLTILSRHFYKSSRSGCGDGRQQQSRAEEAYLIIRIPHRVIIRIPHIRIPHHPHSSSSTILVIRIPYLFCIPRLFHKPRLFAHAHRELFCACASRRGVRLTRCTKETIFDTLFWNKKNALFKNKKIRFLNIKWWWWGVQKRRGVRMTRCADD